MSPTGFARRLIAREGVARRRTLAAASRALLALFDDWGRDELLVWFAAVSRGGWDDPPSSFASDQERAAWARWEALHPTFRAIVDAAGRYDGSARQREQTIRTLGETVSRPLLARSRGEPWPPRRPKGVAVHGRR
jgi:hypothetical protein